MTRDVGNVGHARARRRPAHGRELGGDRGRRPCGHDGDERADAAADRRAVVGRAGRGAPGHRPGNRGPDRRGRQRDRGGRPGRGRRRARRAARLVGHPAPDQGRVPAPRLRADDRRRREARPADGAGERQGAQGREGRGHLRRRVLPLVRRGGGAPGRHGDHRALGSQQDTGAAPAGRRGRAGHAVELPGRYGHPQDRPRTGGRMHGGAQAGQGDAAVRPGGRRDPARGRRSGRRGQRGDHRHRRTGGRGDARRPEGAQALLHRLHRGGAGAAALGGNAPFLVFGDADVDAAVDGAMIAKMRNGGEACTAANRFYVHESVAEEFSARFAARLAALTVGPGLQDGTDVGPLVNADTRSKVATLVEGAAKEGGRVVTGGVAPDRRGYFYAPTVLDQVPPTAAILSEEIFGPVAPIVRFTDTDQAIAMANATEYGLVSYVYTADLRRALRVSEALESGMVGINRGVVSDPAAPFGGVKQSGLGREGGHWGLLEFTEAKYIAVDW